MVKAFSKWKPRRIISVHQFLMSWPLRSARRDIWMCLAGKVNDSSVLENIYIVEGKAGCECVVTGTKSLSHRVKKESRFGRLSDAIFGRFWTALEGFFGLLENLLFSQNILPKSMKQEILQIPSAEILFFSNLRQRSLRLTIWFYQRPHVNKSIFW